MIKNYQTGKRLLNHPASIEARKLNNIELRKTPKRTEILNFLLSLYMRQTVYLEIGIRNPEDNFNHIKADTKYSVDPGYEFIENPATFKMTSDQFFDKLGKNKILDQKIRFDVIFIDGMHLAHQAERDILNALDYIHDDGFIVIHDCNPPTEWHARENYDFKFTPAKGYWNGTTWKAFYKTRFNPDLTSCCIDADWGMGVLSKKNLFNRLSKDINPYYNFQIFNENRNNNLNMIDFESFKRLLKNKLV